MTHLDDFKANLMQWLSEHHAEISVGAQDKTNEFIQYMNDFPNLELDKEDFQKRKRIKNSIPDYNRCIVLKCNGERCVESKKITIRAFVVRI